MSYYAIKAKTEYHWERWMYSQQGFASHDFIAYVDAVVEAEWLQDSLHDDTWTNT